MSAHGKLMADPQTWRSPSLWTRLQLAAAEPSKFESYAVAALSVVIAFVCATLLQPVLRGPITPLFLGAVTVSAWQGGLWPGLFATVLSLPALDFLSGSPTGGQGDKSLLLVFGCVCIVVCVMNALRRYAEVQLRRQHYELENRVARRTEELATLNSSLLQQIAERRRAEETLLTSEENFRALFENAPVAYHEIDSGGVIRRVNEAECRLLQRHRSELVGQPVWEFVISDQREKSRSEILAKVRKEQSIEPFQRQYVLPNGKEICLEIHENLIWNSEGDVIGIRSALLDITARMEAENRIRCLNAELERRVSERTIELERSNEALQQFAYSASHDLQEPLRMVASYTRLLDKRYSGVLDDDGREFLFYIVDGAERMTRMIKDLLAFSRAGSMEQPPPEAIPMEDVVRIALSNLEAALEESSAKVDWEPLPTVHGRRAGLAQVLQNLLSNSIKYRSEEDPQIRISAVAKGSEWLFCISDNGQGFDQDRAEKVFGIFARLHGKEYPGTGMGLAICKRIIERNGGRIWAESSRGEGSKFYFTLPVVEASAPTAAG